MPTVTEWKVEPLARGGSQIVAGGVPQPIAECGELLCQAANAIRESAVELGADPLELAKALRGGAIARLEAQAAELRKAFEDVCVCNDCFGRPDLDCKACENTGVITPDLPTGAGEGMLAELDRLHRVEKATVNQLMAAASHVAKTVEALGPRMPADVLAELGVALEALSHGVAAVVHAIEFEPGEQA